MSRKTMKQYCVLLGLLLWTASCGSSSKENIIVEAHLVNIPPPPPIAPNEPIISEDTATNQITEQGDIATYFVVIADTSQDYFLLHEKMVSLSKSLPMPIDTMGRYYNREKNLIALPDTSEDEIYAGDYFPRRFPSESLSLEYLALYQKAAGEKTIALVQGIYPTEAEAEQSLHRLQKQVKAAFVTQSKMYIGCMH